MNVRCSNVVFLSIVLLIGCQFATVNRCAQRSSGTASSHESSQARASDSNERKTVSDIQNGKTVAVPIADLTLTVPSELSEGPPTSELKKNGDVTWTDSSYEWKAKEKRNQGVEVYVLVSITTWDNDFPPSVPGGRAPETILERHFADIESDKQSLKIEELTYLRIDGLNGIFFRAPLGGDRIQLNWLTYRYHRNKAQHLAITVYGDRSDLEKLLRIINSAKFAER